MKNEDLKEIYNRIYLEGEEGFFSKYSDGRDTSDIVQMVLSAVDWRGRRVLDVGCGSGLVAAEIASRGAAFVTGIDYAEAAIQKAKRSFSRDNLEYRCMALDDWAESADLVVSLGTLEHLDDPGASLRAMAHHLIPGGKVLVSCPCFINLRGLVWMTLQLLQDVPMSLTDIHFLSPFDIEEMAAASGLSVERIESCDQSKGNGDEMLSDLETRLTNALRDAQIDNSRIHVLLDWLKKVAGFLEFSECSSLMGATGFYVIEKPEPAAQR